MSEATRRDEMLNLHCGGGSVWLFFNESSQHFSAAFRDLRTMKNAAIAVFICDTTPSLARVISRTVINIRGRRECLCCLQLSTVSNFAFLAPSPSPGECVSHDLSVAEAPIDKIKNFTMKGHSSFAVNEFSVSASQPRGS